MRKQFFLWTTVVLIFLLLIFAFANILYVQQYYLLFFSLNLSATVAILMAGFNGFLIGFFSMLYSYEIRREKELKQQEEATGSSPAEVIDEQPVVQEVLTKANEPTQPVDEFDEDDEVLG